MKTENLKEIWKKNIINEINSYSDSEIKSIILKSARKTILSTYQVFLLMLLVSVAIVLLAWFYTGNFMSSQMLVFYLILGVILLICAGIVFFSLRWMQKYSSDVPLRDWLESRIEALNKSINMKKKYRVMGQYGAAGAVMITYWLIQTMTTGFRWQSLLVGIIAMVIISRIVSKISDKALIKSRNRLQELYDQLED